MYKVNLSWMEVNSEELGFNIYRDTSPLDIYDLPSPIATLPPNTTNWEDEDPPQDTQVYYIVSTFDDEEEVYGDEISVYVGDAAPIPDDIMILNVKGPIAVSAYTSDGNYYTGVDIEYSQDGTNWDTFVNYVSPVSEGELYLRGPEGARIDKLEIAHNDFVGNFLGVEKWWDVGANLPLGRGTYHNFTVPEHSPPNVTDMSYMFNNARAFNQDISMWDTSNVTNMDSMFQDARMFNQPIGGWDTSKVTNMARVLNNASEFNQDISDWDTSNVTTMRYALSSTPVFNQDIGGWDTSNVTSMVGMFAGASEFDQDISDWDTSKVTDMNDMFSSAGAFNQPLANWDVSNVTNMSFMFDNALAFNQDISEWNTSSVTDMSGMFRSAYEFNQDISGWCVTNIPSLPFFFSDGSALVSEYHPVWGTCPA